MKEKQKKVKRIGEITHEEFKKLEAKYGAIDLIEVPNKDFTEYSVGYLKPISRQLMGAALSVTDPIAGKEMVLNEIFVEGDKRILNEDQYFYSACTVVGELMSFPKAILKKNYQQPPQ